MGRPPLPIGTYGKIRTYELRSGHWRATTKYRDHDGVTRPVERVGKTEAAAVRRLKADLRDRSATTSGPDVGADTRFRDLAEKWYMGVTTAVESGTRSPTTADTYRRTLDNHVLPGLGAFQLRELTVPAVDRFLSAVRDQAGTPTAKTCRSVVSGAVGLAVRHGAMGANPVRDTSRMEGKPRRKPRALTLVECLTWLGQLETDRAAVRHDLPDLCRFMLATGVRIGESLAVYRPDVDLDAATVAVDHTVVRVRGRGLIRKRTKTEAGERLLPLPSWAVAMLRRRFADTDRTTGPVFPDSVGGLRDPSNTRRSLRDARGSDGFAWVTSHTFRKTTATLLDDAGLSARVIADQLGHSRPSMTQDVYLGRKAVTRATADALELLAGDTDLDEK